MARFARFGRAWGEFASQIKSNPLVTSWKGGARKGFSTLGHSFADPYTERGASAFTEFMTNLRPGADGAIHPKDQLRAAGKAFRAAVGPDLKYMGGGAAVGLGYGGYRSHRDGHVSGKQLVAYTMAGAAVGAKVSTFQMYRNSAGNPLADMVRSPLRAWRKSAL